MFQARAVRAVVGGAARQPDAELVGTSEQRGESAADDDGWRHDAKPPQDADARRRRQSCLRRTWCVQRHVVSVT